MLAEDKKEKGEFLASLILRILPRARQDLELAVSASAGRKFKRVPTRRQHQEHREDRLRKSRTVRRLPEEDPPLANFHSHRLGHLEADPAEGQPQVDQKAAAVLGAVIKALAHLSVADQGDQYDARVLQDAEGQGRNRRRAEP